MEFVLRLNEQEKRELEEALKARFDKTEGMLFERVPGGNAASGVDAIGVTLCQKRQKLALLLGKLRAVKDVSRARSEAEGRVLRMEMECSGSIRSTNVPFNPLAAYIEGARWGMKVAA